MMHLRILMCVCLMICGAVVSSGAETIISYQYDANGQLSGISQPNGAGSLTYKYDATGNPIRISGHVDVDQDGIDDAWEQYWFGNLTNINASSDFDHDGMLDAQEFLVNTDPVDADSLLSVHLGHPGPDGIYTLRWLAEPNVRYDIYATTNLTSGTWLPFRTNMSYDTGDYATLHVTSDVQKTYFKIGVQQ